MWKSIKNKMREKKKTQSYQKRGKQSSESEKKREQRR